MQTHSKYVGALTFAAWLALPSIVHAGMPSFNLTDVGRMRLSTLSFFLVGFLASAWGIQRLWNLLQRDFQKLPRLTFKVAVGIVFLWGVLFVLVLTMISGARELMTPGAWEKKGATYQLAETNGDNNPPERQVPLIHRREEQLHRLHVQLLGYAARHEGQYPPDDAVAELDSSAWDLPDRLGTRYLYVPGRSAKDGDEVVAYEPQVYDDAQLVLWTDGRVAPMSASELQNTLKPGKTP